MLPPGPEGPMRYPLPPVEQLKAVFQLCDQDNSGMVRVEHLQDLAKFYTSEDTQELEDLLKHFDPQERGVISFREFYNGVCSVLKQHQTKSSANQLRESMMSPSPAPVIGPAMETGSEPRFVISSSLDAPPGLDSPAGAAKSQCSSLSDGENYECYGEGVELDLDSGIASDRHNGENAGTRSPLGNPGINRHTWLRTSLRRSPPSHKENLPNRRWGSFRHSGKRQLGSNALASQLYRSSSFNSSGRSSTCDTADDMYSDVSLEETSVVHIQECDFLDIKHEVHRLQQQVEVLNDSAEHKDERYTRAKAETAALQARMHMLEEQLRESEIRHEDRLQEEQRRAKELLSRVEREKQQQLENCAIRVAALELETGSLREEAARQRGRAERLEAERQEVADQLRELRHELAQARDTEHGYREQERRLIIERQTNAQLIEDLSAEVLQLRSASRTPALPTTAPDALRLEELHAELAQLRQENKALAECNDELQASLITAGVEQGRLLTVVGETSLAAELEAMSHDQIQTALKEQQEVNAQLRCYIDGILLNIVENHPQLLEVKQRSA